MSWVSMGQASTPGPAALHSPCCQQRPCHANPWEHRTWLMSQRQPVVL